MRDSLQTNAVPPLSYLTGENINKCQVSKEPVNRRTVVPLIAPIAMLILSCIFTSAPLFQPPGLERDWPATFFYAVLGITFLLISIKFFAECSKQRKEDAGEESTDD